MKSSDQEQPLVVKIIKILDDNFLELARNEQSLLE
jgi:hypothetical protein